MARRGGGSDPNEALELFLDTISNTFGGVLFIAMLVCVLLQVSGFQPEAEGDPVRAARLAGQVSEIEGQIERMRASLAATEDQIRAVSSGASDPTRVRQFAGLKQQKAEREARLAAAQAHRGRVEQGVNAKTGLLAQLLKEIEKLKQKLAGVERQLTNTTEGAVARLRVPQARAIDKQPVFVMLTGGRATFVYRYGGAGMEPTGQNTDDATFREIARQDGGQRSRVLEIRPRPGRGAPLDSADTARQLVSRFDKNRHLVSIAVWPDSFEQCEILRDHLIAQDFNYFLVFMEADEPVTLTKGQSEGF